MKKINKLTALALTTLTFAFAAPIVKADLDSQLTQVTTKKTYSDAESIALKEVKTGVVSDIDLKIKKNKPVYDVTIIDGNQETELRIDANTGKIIKTKVETEDDNDNQALSSANPKSDFTTIEKAAKKDYPDATIESIELKANSNTVYYKVDLIDGNQEIEAIYSADDASKESETVEIDD